MTTSRIPARPPGRALCGIPPVQVPPAEPGAAGRWEGGSRNSGGRNSGGRNSGGRNSGGRNTERLNRDGRTSPRLFDRPGGQHTQPDHARRLIQGRGCQAPRRHHGRIIASRGRALVPWSSPRVSAAPCTCCTSRRDQARRVRVASSSGLQSVRAVGLGHHARLGDRLRCAEPRLTPATRTPIRPERAGPAIRQGGAPSSTTVPTSAGLKKGTGLILDLGSSVRLAIGHGDVRHRTRRGRRAQGRRLRCQESGEPGLDDDGRQREQRVGSVIPSPFAEQVQGQYLVVWFTKLPPMARRSASSWRRSSVSPSAARPDRAHRSGACEPATRPGSPGRRPRDRARPAWPRLFLPPRAGSAS